MRWPWQRRPPAEAALRTWTRAKDVAVFGPTEDRARLERSLAREGISMRGFEDLGGKAPEILTQFVPSAVVALPGVDGARLANALEAHPTLSKVPWIWLETAAPPSHDAAPHRSVGTNDLHPTLAEVAPDLFDGL